MSHFHIICYIFFLPGPSFVLCLPQPHQVPRERKCSPSGVKTTDTSAVTSNNYGSLEMVDPHCQALRSMPVNLSLNNSTTTELHSSKHGSTGFTGENRREDTKDRGSGPLSLVKAEGHTSMPVSCSGSSYQQEHRGQLMGYEQNCYDLSLTGYLKDEQSSTPDSTYEDSVEGEVSLFFYLGRVLWMWCYIWLYKSISY